jgi:hypothetical protein
LLVNGSSEAENFQPNPDGFEGLLPGSTAITGWTVFNAETAWCVQPNSYGIVASDGTHMLDLTGYHNSFPYGGVEQTISTTTGSAYTLGIDVGSVPGSPLDGGPTTVQVTAAAVSQSFTNPGTGPGQRVHFDTNFTATSASTNIQIVGLQGIDYIGVDNVSVNSSVPEPSGIVLAILGVPFAAALIRRRFA